MRVSNVQLQRWIETYQPPQAWIETYPQPQVWIETYQPPQAQFDLHQLAWCVYNGKNTYAEDCPCTLRTGHECLMKHKKRYSYQGWEYSNANKCTGRRMTFDGRSPNPGGASECTQHERWCPGCLRQHAMFRREQLKYEAASTH
jgi:hypothetical protein